ncbi:restriction endonuclease subunit S [Phocaeicola vulgatus]|nr:restriction endonuclease subunit S [Phocaeicola vulgatus]
MTKLSSIADYVTDKISSNDIALREYVTTDCILQNKKGREIATNLPPQSCCLTRYQHGDVLIANIRPYLKKVWFADIDGGASSDVLVFRAKEGHSPSFLYAVLLQDSFFDYVMQGAKGSKMPRGDKEQILRYEMPTLSCSEESIGTFFLNLDQKIRLNEQINQNLEAMAKQLYDYWFVQFDFPNENGRPYKSFGGKMVWNEKQRKYIPEYWEVKSLSNWLEIKSGFPFKSETYKPIGRYKIITIKNVQDGELVTSGCDYVNDIPSRAKDYISLQIGDRLISLTGNCGRLCVVCEENLLLNQRVGLLCCDAIYLEYFYNFLNSGTMRTVIDNLANGAAQANLSPVELCKTDCFIPPIDILLSYNRKVNAIRKAIVQNNQEISQLAKQRDELLPLLMNGQVSVNSDLSNGL